MFTSEGNFMNRYDRQIRVDQIGPAGQKRIEQAVILIVGSGALGTYAAEQLVRTGVKHIILVDDDVVEESNLQRQTLFTEEDALQKKAKVQAAKEKLLQIHSNTTIEVYQERFDQALFHNFSALDLVLDCTDNYLARRLINDYCLAYQLPFIFASCAATSGQVMALKPATKPCLSCVFPKLSELEKKGCDTIGVITPLVPLISSIQISLALQYLVGTPPDFQTLYMIESWPLQVSTFQVAKRPDCPICGQKEKTRGAALTETCGHVFQTTFQLSLKKIAAYCVQEKIAYQENPIALRVKRDSFEITFFKNGHTLFYGFTQAQAQKAYHWIQQQNFSK